MTTIRITHAASGLNVVAQLVPDKAPANTNFLLRYLDQPRIVPAIHAMWTGPEISCPIPSAHLVGAPWANALPPENATIHPQPGDVVLAYVPPRMWGGNPDPIFDIGLYYGPGARLFFPIGWLAGSVVAQVRPEDRASLAEACGKIRRTGACEITFEKGGLMDDFELYDLRVELIAPADAKIYCGNPGDWFELHGEQLHLPAGQSFSIYSLAAILPLLPAKQRMTHPNDWMTSDAEVACPDPNCPSRLRITRLAKRRFTHAETTAVALPKDMP